jgi:hypothetical protein
VTFPARLTVDHYAYVGSESSTDELGNVVDAWASTPTARAAQSWQSVDREKLGNFAQGEIFDVSLSLPPDWVPALHDRIGLPDGVYEVVGFRMQDKGFHGWQPGNIVLLKRTTGIV